jgi:hypothetical protein
MTGGGLIIKSDIPFPEDFKNGIYQNGEDVSMRLGIGPRETFKIRINKEDPDNPYLVYDYDARFYKESDDEIQKKLTRITLSRAKKKHDLDKRREKEEGNHLNPSNEHDF